MEKEKVCPYVAKSKSWLIKNVLSHFLAAAQLNEEIYRDHVGGRKLDFDRIKRLSELLFRAKEDLHLIFKRLRDPRRRIFEEVPKCRPDAAEQSFIHNVGLLFHKAMVARELQYILEYYEDETDFDYQDVRQSLAEDMNKLKLLFEKTAQSLGLFLRNFKDDVVILAFLFENQRQIEKALSLDLSEILKQLNDFDEAENRKRVADYFLRSGWPERADSMLDAASQTEQ